MEKMTARLVRGIDVIVVVFFVAIFVFYIAQVGGRFVTGCTWMWTMEVSRGVMMYVTFIACGPLIRSGGHIAVEILPTRLRGTPLAINKFFIHLVLLAVVLLATYYGVGVTLEYYSSGIVYIAEWRLPVWGMTFLAIPVGMGLAIVITLQMLVSDLRSIFRRKPGTEVSQ